MGIAEMIYELVKQLPEETAKQVLDFAQDKRAKLDVDAREERRRAATAVLRKYAGRFKVKKFDRAELNDREKLR